MDLQLTALQFVTQYGNTGPFNVSLTLKKFKRCLENPTKRNIKRWVVKSRYSTFNITPVLRGDSPKLLLFATNKSRFFLKFYGDMAGHFILRSRRAGAWWCVIVMGIKGIWRHKDCTHTKYKCLGTNIKIIHLYDFALCPGKFILAEAELCISQVWDATNFLPGYNLLHLSHYIHQNSPQSFPFLPGIIRTALMLTVSFHGAPYFQLFLHTDEDKNNSGGQGDELSPERDSSNLFCFHWNDPMDKFTTQLKWLSHKNTCAQSLLHVRTTSC